jgi:hypothetical protein
VEEANRRHRRLLRSRASGHAAALPRRVMNARRFN